MKIINVLSLKEKIGQLFIVGINGKKIDDRVKKLITEYKVGGIILYKRNYSSYDEMMNHINELKKINSVNKIPLLISIDQEGGRVNRMPDEFVNLKPAKKLASKKDYNIIKESGSVIGKMLYQSGVNMNFAPVADIKSFPDHHPIGDRCYSDNPEEVSKCVISFIEGLKSERVIPVVKHFPGHGATKKDSHYFLPIIKKTINEMEEKDLIPFKESIENGVDCILVGHLLFSNIDKRFPVSLSKRFITRYLRKKYRFNGVVISDDIKMKAVEVLYGPKRASIRALKAGNDIVIMRIPFDSQIQVLETTKKLVEKNYLPEYKINKKIRRILELKQKYQINDNIAQGCNISEINELIKSVNNKV